MRPEADSGAALEVTAPGVHSTVQDFGRIGYRDAGVPVSGPLDRSGLQLANALVGNPPGTAALELLLQGPACVVAADSVRIALAGCNGAIELGGERSGSGAGAGEPTAPRGRIEAGRSVRLMRGESFRVAHLGDSACGYLAVEGGFALTPCLDSTSTYVRGRFGGFDGLALKAGARLPLALPGVPARPERRLAGRFELGLTQPIRVVLGPQAECFTAAAIETLLSAEYRVTAQSDRMGFRLAGPLLAHAKGYNIVSDGIVPGAIQVPGSGLPIVLLADAQTTGGYPKIATVVSADLGALGRRKPGLAVRFAAVSVAQAEGLRRQQQAQLQEAMSSLRRVEEGAAEVDLSRLYGANLISGVVAGTE